MNMVAPWNYEQMAAQMEPHQFELLLRAYVRAKALRAQERISGGGERRSKDVSLNFHAVLSDLGSLTRGSWTVNYGWGSDTKGEILEPALTELCRREGWSQGPMATLLQIEGGRTED